MASQRTSTDGAITSNDNTKVFISYSRKDGDFAEQLRDELIRQGFEAYLDKHDIAPGEPWQERLSGLILIADTVVFCLSPNYIASEICDWEVNEAERIGKRLLPVVCASTPDANIPQRLKRLNYIFMRDANEFTAGMRQLITALNTDIKWIRTHTRFGERASEWLAAGRSEALLMRGVSISNAETWITARPREAPEITEAIGGYIGESRRAATSREAYARRRGQIITGASVIAAAIMGMLGWFFYSSWAESQFRQSLFLSDLSRQQTELGDAMTGTLLALEGLRDNNSSEFTQKLRPYASQPELRLYSSLKTAREMKVISPQLGEFKGSSQFFNNGLRAFVQISQERSFIVNSLSGHHEVIEASNSEHTPVKSQNIERLALLNSQNTIVIFDPNELKTINLTIISSRFEIERIIAISNVKHLIAFKSGNFVHIFDYKLRSKITSFTPHSTRIWGALFSPDDSMLVLHHNIPEGEGGEYKGILDIWYSLSGDHWKRLDGEYGWHLTFSFSADGKYFAAATKELGNCCEARGEIYVWNVRENWSLRTLKGHTHSLRSLSLHPTEGMVLSVSHDRSARIWRIDNKQSEILAQPDGSDFAVSASFSPDGSRVVVGAKDGSINISTVKKESKERPVNIRIDANRLIDVGFLDGSDMLATLEANGVVRIWDVRSGTKLVHQLDEHEVPQQHLLDGHRAPFSHVCPKELDCGNRLGAPKFSSARVISSGTDKTVGPSTSRGADEAVLRIIEETSTYSPRYSFYNHGWSSLQGTAPTDIGFSPGFSLFPLSKKKSDEFEFLQLAINGNRTRAVTQAAKLDSKTGKFRYSPIFLRNAKTGTILKSINYGSQAEPPLLAFSQNGMYLSILTKTGFFRVISTQDASEVLSLKGVVRSGFGEHSRLLIVSSNEKLMQWIGEASPRKGDYEQRLDQRVISIFRLSDGKWVGRAATEEGSLLSWTTHPNGQLVAFSHEEVDSVTGGFQFHYWDLDQTIQTRSGPGDGSVRFLKFSADGSHLFSASAGGTLKLWKEGGVSGTLELRTDDRNLVSAAMDLERSRIATTSADSSVTIWNIATGERIAQLFGTGEPLSNLSFSSAGDILMADISGQASGLSAPVGRVSWSIKANTQELIEFSKRQVTRCLTPEQRKRFFLSPEPPSWCYSMNKWPYQGSQSN